MKKAVFFDRDGVLNRSLVVNFRPYGPKSVEEFVLDENIAELSRLRDLGYLLIVTTNQPDVANGIITREFVDQLHGILSDAFTFDDILVCYHNNKDACDCRKPEPGMLHQARDKYGIDLTKSYMVGDRWRDVLAGQAAGCTTLLIDHGYKEEAPDFKADFSCHSLLSAIEWIEAKSAV